LFVNQSERRLFALTVFPKIDIVPRMTSVGRSGIAIICIIFAG